MKVGMISLGCPINLVDTEMALGLFREAGLKIVNNAEEADLLVINTCTHSKEAKKESVNTIFEISQHKLPHQKIVVMGCMVQHYQNTLIENLPEVDKFIALEDYSRFGEIIQDVIGPQANMEPGLRSMNRVLTSASFWAYVKIGDGSDESFTYCASPLIRGKMISRAPSEIMEEVSQLISQGAQEIVLIGPASSNYGKDFSPNKKSKLAHLLNTLSQLPNLKKLRVMNVLPGDMNEDLLNVYEKDPKILPFFDLPILHVAPRIAKIYNRKESKEDLLNLIQKIRQRVPQAFIQTSVVVGTPDETDEEFHELEVFLEEARLDRIKVIIYGIDEASPLRKLTDSIPDSEKRRRAEQLNKLIRRITLQQAKSRIGHTYQAIINGFDVATKRYKGHSFLFSPDVNSGYLFIESPQPLNQGAIVQVEITDVVLNNILARWKETL